MALAKTREKDRKEAPAKLRRAISVKRQRRILAAVLLKRQKAQVKNLTKPEKKALILARPKAKQEI